MDQLIQLLIWVLIFGIAGYGLWWGCAKFAMPQPVLWICGGIWLIVLLMALSGQISMPQFRFR
jgi:hypothetical protein